MYDRNQEARSILCINFENTKTKELIRKIDDLLTKHLKNILSFHGWVAISKFGNETNHQAWSLVQHADNDHTFQRKCLDLLKTVVPLKETDLKNYTYLMIVSP